MNRRIVQALALCAAVLSTVPAEAAETWKLRLNLDAGESYRFEMVQDQTVDIAMGAMGNQQVRSENRIDIVQHVKERKSGGMHVIEFVYDDIKMTIDAMGQQMSFDSDGATSPELAQVGELLKDLRFTAEMSPLGKIESIEGLENLWDKATATSSNPQAAQMMEMMKQSFSSDTIKGMMEQASVPFPENAVGVGEGWSHTFTADNPALGEVTTETDYKVEGTEACGKAECLRVALKLAMDSAGGGQMLDRMKEMFEQQGAQVDFDVNLRDVNATGTAWIDPETGLQRKMEMDIAMDMAISIKMNVGEMVNEMNMDMRINQDLVMALVEDGSE